MEMSQAALDRRGARYAWSRASVRIGGFRQYSGWPVCTRESGKNRQNQIQKPRIEQLQAEYNLYLVGEQYSPSI